MDFAGQERNRRAGGRQRVRPYLVSRSMELRRCTYRGRLVHVPHAALRQAVFERGCDARRLPLLLHPRPVVRPSSVGRLSLQRDVRALPPACATRSWALTRVFYSPFVFGDSSYLRGDGEVALSDSFIGYWTSFAATGNPNHDGAVTWPDFRTAEQTLQLDLTIKAIDPFKTRECDAWDRVQP